MKIIICIPAYNEEENIGKTIEEIKNSMNKTKYNYQILVLDDGSIDWFYKTKCHLSTTKQVHIGLEKYLVSVIFLFSKNHG